MAKVIFLGTLTCTKSPNHEVDGLEILHVNMQEGQAQLDAIL